MKIKHFLTTLIVSILIFSCQKQQDFSTDNNAAKTILNISYGTDPLQNMDAYLPANRSTASTKVLIAIHGGAWESGDKTDFSDYIDTFKNRLPDYAIFNINYRLSVNGTNVFPTQENDVKAAFDYIVNNSAGYNIFFSFFHKINTTIHNRDRLSA